MGQQVAGRVVNEHRFDRRLCANAFPGSLRCFQACARWLDGDFGPRSAPVRDPRDFDLAGVYSHRHRSQFVRGIVAEGCSNLVCVDISAWPSAELVLDLFQRVRDQAALEDAEHRAP
jgi:hypothetical protein